ncbi:MAG: hypothetical protein ACYC40_00600 [Patescibacteria group bacterium]
MKKFILFVCLMALTIGTEQWEEIIAIAAIVLGINLAVSVVVFIVIKLRFTILTQHENEIILLHYKGNKVKIYEKAIWGKPRITIIRLAYGWLREIKGGERKIIETDLSVEMGISTVALIPLKIEYRFSGPFKAADLQAKLKINTSKKAKARIISGLNIFKPVIKTPYRDPMKFDIIRWNNGRISQWDLAQKIMAQVDFPEKFFSNMKRIKVEIGAPKLVLTLRK